MDARIERQKIFDSDDPPDVCVLLDEAVLHRCIGNPQIMREQLTHLARLSGRPMISVQVIPLSVGAHVGLVGAFAIARFDESQAGTVYLEKQDSGLTIRDARALAKVSLAWDRLRGEAAGGAGSGGAVVFPVGGEFVGGVGVVRRSGDVKGFKVLPRRWVVERTNAWVLAHRRLTRDYERLAECSEAVNDLAVIDLAVTGFMVARLAGGRVWRNWRDMTPSPSAMRPVRRLGGTGSTGVVVLAAGERPPGERRRASTPGHPSWRLLSRWSHVISGAVRVPFARYARTVRNYARLVRWCPVFA